MKIAHGCPPRHVEECLRRRALRRQATSPGVFANGPGPAAREETNEVGHSGTGSLLSHTRRAAGPLKPESALPSPSLLVVRGDTVNHCTARDVELLVALDGKEFGRHRGRHDDRVDRALPWVNPRPRDRTSSKRNVTD